MPSFDLYRATPILERAAFFTPALGILAQASPFTSEIIQAAQERCQRKWQIPSSLAMSAAAIESGLGKATPPGSNNWFGIKDPHGVSTATNEQTHAGQVYSIVAGFKVFATWQDGFDYYGRLLGLGSPYHDMVTEYLRSPRTPADVQRLTNHLTGVYASAINYGEALIAVQVKNNLYQFDVLPHVIQIGGSTVNDTTTTTTTTTAPAPAPVPVPAPVPAPAPAPAPASVAPHQPTPTIGSPVVVDWGDLANQILTHESPIVESGIAAGVSLALPMLPMGSFLSMFVTPKLVTQYAQMAINLLETKVAGASISVPAGGIAAIAANMFNANEAKLLAFLGGNILPMFEAEVAKLTGAAPAAPAA